MLIKLRRPLVKWLIIGVTWDGEMNRQYLLGAIILGMAACTTQGPEIPESSTVAASGVADEDTLICKHERPTGSLMKKKICLSAADWKRIEEGAHEFFDVSRTKAAALK